MKFCTTENTSRVVNRLVHRIALVGEDTVETLNIGQFKNLVGFHGIHTDTCHTTVNLVVREQIFSVVNAIRVGTMYVMGVTGIVFHRAIRLGTNNRFGLVGNPQPIMHSVLKTGICFSVRPEGKP